MLCSTLYALSYIKHKLYFIFSIISILQSHYVIRAIIEELEKMKAHTGITEQLLSVCIKDFTPVLSDLVASAASKIPRDSLQLVQH